MMPDEEGSLAVPVAKVKWSQLERFGVEFLTIEEAHRYDSANYFTMSRPDKKEGRGLESLLFCVGTQFGLGWLRRL
jgi:hypothetical protein